MTWLQENWIVALVGLLMVLTLVLALLRSRSGKADAAPLQPPAQARKPLEPVRPDIVAAEPARFKPAEPEASAPAGIETPVAPSPAAAAAPSPAAAQAAGEGGDNLQLLKGVGPKLAALLAGQGITSFAQIAAWTADDVAAIDPTLGAFKGRIERDNLVDQAGFLARGDKAGFEAKYGALGGEL